MDLAAARDRISVYAAPATEADLDNKQCNKCKRANGTRSPLDALEKRVEKKESRKKINYCTNKIT